MRNLCPSCITHLVSPQWERISFRFLVHNDEFHRSRVYWGLQIFYILDVAKEQRYLAYLINYFSYKKANKKHLKICRVKTGYTYSLCSVGMTSFDKLPFCSLVSYLTPLSLSYILKMDIKMTQNPMRTIRNTHENVLYRVCYILCAKFFLLMIHICNVLDVHFWNFYLIILPPGI
jgi:hypothetical protein